MILTGPQVAQLAYQAGFRGEDLATIVGIVMQRESHGDTDAHRTDNPNKAASTTGDFGLAQINSSNLNYLRLKLGISTMHDLLDPLTNLRAAHTLFLAGGFKPWAAVQGQGFSAGGNPLAGVSIGQARADVAAAQSFGMFETPFSTTERPPDMSDLYGSAGVTGIPGNTGLSPSYQSSTAETPPLSQDAQGGWGSFDPRFGAALRAMISASGGRVSIGTGVRSSQAQEQMFLQRYQIDDINGTITWNGHKWRHVRGPSAAPPGDSMHEIGLAADLVGDLSWVQANAARFGLKTFASVNNEPWHVQLAALPNSRNDYEKSPDYRPYAGGGAGSTAASAATSGITPMPGATPEQIADAVKRNYGYMGAFMAIPEVRKLLVDAVTNGWDKDTLQGKLSATQWWQTTSSASRAWTQLISEDPASAKAQVQSTFAQLRDQAHTYGLTLTDDQLLTLATDVNKFGWSGAETIDNLLRNVDWGQVAPGTLTAGVDQMKALAARYLIRLSDETAQSYATRMASGELNEAGVTSIFQQQAKGRFNYIAPLLDQGITPADYFAPAKDAIASTLEVGSATIDMTDPSYMAMLEVRDPKSGELRAATLNEAMLAARKRPEWARTKNATELVTSMGTKLRDAWGMN